MSSSKANFSLPGYSPEAWRNLSLHERNQRVMEYIDDEINKSQILLVPPLDKVEDLVKKTEDLIPKFVFPKTQRNIRKPKTKHIKEASNRVARSVIKVNVKRDEKKNQTNLETGGKNSKPKERREKDCEINVTQNDNDNRSEQAKRTEEKNCEADQSTKLIKLGEKVYENREYKKNSDDENEDSTTKIVKLLENDIDTISRTGPSIVREYHFQDCFKPSARIYDRQARVRPFSKGNNIKDLSSKALQEYGESFSKTSNDASVQSPRKHSNTTIGSEVLPDKMKQLKYATVKIIKRKSALSKAVNMRINSGRPQVLNMKCKSSYILLPPISQKLKQRDSDKNREICRPFRKRIKLLRRKDQLRTGNHLVLPVISLELLSSPGYKGSENSKETSESKGSFGNKSTLLNDSKIEESRMSTLPMSKRGLPFHAAVSSLEEHYVRKSKDSLESVVNFQERPPKYLPPLSP